ncbi:MAG: tetratricopeptide repeat protein, partial [Planctomycetota bacterium]|nr:tetratricopeptide repeat protein [Planctomycetota bacterium]
KSKQNNTTSYKKQDIADIKRAYTNEELYEFELKKTSINDAYSWYRLAEWCLNKGLDDKAVSALKEALKLNNRELKFYITLGEHYLLKNNFDNEITLYQDALTFLLVNKEIIYYRLGNSYERLRLYDEALFSYEKAVNIAPNYVEALIKSGNLYRIKKDYTEAGKIYERIKNLKSGIPSGGPTHLAFLEGFSLFLYQMGRFEEVKTLLSDTHAQKQTETSSELLNLLGMMALLEADYKQASQHFLQSIYLAPYSSPSFINLGLLYLVGNLPADAEMLFLEGMDFNPVDESPYIGLAYLKWANNKQDETFSLLKTALKMVPDSFIARYVRGIFYFRAQKYAQSSEDFQWCLSLDPTRIETLYYLAMISLYQKDYKKATQYYKSYLSQIPAGSRTLADAANLALLFLAEGEINQTQKILEEPSMAPKKYVPFLAISAYINYKERKIEKAIKLLEEALAIDPSNLWIRNNLLKIT